MADRLLWFDAETTGLKYKTRDVVLEVAWTLTDMYLKQISPLRSYFTEWRPPTSPELHRPVPGSDDWTDMGGVHAAVLEMHEQSRLAAEWPFRVHVGADAIQGLILNDLGVTRMASGEVYLAGAGVSHFDQSLVALHMPALAPKDDGGRLHYRCFDTSVADLVTGIDSRAILADYHGPGHTHTFHCSCLKLDGPEPLSLNEHLDLSAVVPHRAASDVALALVGARALRYSLGLDSPLQLG
jgi:oligoribonuclease (3'-5' exoribonuclease)